MANQSTGDDAPLESAVAQDDVHSAGENVDVVLDFTRNLRCLLNKMTPEKYEFIVDQVTDLPVNTEEKLLQFVDLVYCKAVAEPKYAFLYVALISEISSLTVPAAEDPSVTTGVRKCLLKKCQEEFFKIGSKPKVELKATKVPLNPRPPSKMEPSSMESSKQTSPSEQSDLAEQEKEEARIKKSLGLVRFVAELYKKEMINFTVANGCVTHLLDEGTEEALLCLCEFIVTAGQHMENESVQGFHNTVMRISSYLKAPHLSLRVNRQLRSVYRLVHSGWVSHWTTHREEMMPKKLYELTVLDSDEDTSDGEFIDELETDLEVKQLHRKVISLLNKICPQKYDLLEEKINSTRINSEEALKMLVKAIFLKAINEPLNAQMYVRLCVKMQEKSVKTSTALTFKSLMLSQCARAFKRQMELLGSDSKETLGEIEKAVGKDDTNLEMMEDETETRMKEALGLMRFIGEMYNVQMIGQQTVHNCILSLMVFDDNCIKEKYLFCLLELLVTAGKVLEHETSKQEMLAYFDKLSEVSQNASLSRRCRATLLNVIDLRRRDWISLATQRKTELSPKTLDSLKKEVNENRVSQLWQKRMSESREAPPPSVFELKYCDRTIGDMPDAQLQRSMKGILNRLSYQKFDLLADKFKVLPLNSFYRLEMAARLIISTAVYLPMQCQLFVELCAHIQDLSVLVNLGESSGDQLIPRPGDPSIITFKDLLLNLTSDRDSIVVMMRRDLKPYFTILEMLCCSEDKQRVSDYISEKSHKLKVFSIGLSRFIGELYKRGILSHKSFCVALRKVLRPDASQNHLLCAYTMLLTAGQDLEDVYPKMIATYFEQIEDLVDDDENLPTETKHLLKELVELRERDWEHLRDIDLPDELVAMQKTTEVNRLLDSIEVRSKASILERTWNECPEKPQPVFKSGSGVGGRGHTNTTAPSRNQSSSSAKKPLLCVPEEPTVRKTVRSLMNKLTAETLEKCISQLLELQLESEDELMEIVNHIFERVCDDSLYLPLYTELCRGLQKLVVTKLVVDDGEQTRVATSSFRKLLLNKCQAEFEKTTSHVEDTEEIGEGNPIETHEQEMKPLKENQQELKRKSVGLVRFIGELYKCCMLTPKIVLGCATALVSQASEERLECACKLLTSIGKRLERESSQSTAQVFQKLFQDLYELTQSSSDPPISRRMKFMIEDLLELRRNKWCEKIRNQSLDADIQYNSLQPKKKYASGGLSFLRGSWPYGNNTESPFLQHFKGDAVPSVGSAGKFSQWVSSTRKYAVGRVIDTSCSGPPSNEIPALVTTDFGPADVSWKKHKSRNDESSNNQSSKSDGNPADVSKSDSGDANQQVSSASTGLIGGLTDMGCSVPLSYIQDKGGFPLKKKSKRIFRKCVSLENQPLKVSNNPQSDGNPAVVSKSNPGDGNQQTNSASPNLIGGLTVMGCSEPPSSIQGDDGFPLKKKSKKKRKNRDSLGNQLVKSDGNPADVSKSGPGDDNQQESSPSTELIGGLTDMGCSEPPFSILGDDGFPLKKKSKKKRKNRDSLGNQLVKSDGNPADVSKSGPGDGNQQTSSPSTELIGGLTDMGCCEPPFSILGDDGFPLKKKSKKKRKKRDSLGNQLVKSDGNPADVSKSCPIDANQQSSSPSTELIGRLADMGCSELPSSNQGDNGFPLKKKSKKDRASLENQPVKSDCNESETIRQPVALDDDKCTTDPALKGSVLLGTPIEESSGHHKLTSSSLVAEPSKMGAMESKTEGIDSEDECVLSDVESPKEAGKDVQSPTTDGSRSGDHNFTSDGLQTGVTSTPQSDECEQHKSTPVSTSDMMKSDESNTGVLMNSSVSNTSEETVTATRKMSGGCGDSKAVTDQEVSFDEVVVIDGKHEFENRPNHLLPKAFVCCSSETEVKSHESKTGVELNSSTSNIFEDSVLENRLSTDDCGNMKDVETDHEVKRCSLNNVSVTFDGLESRPDLLSPSSSSASGGSSPTKKRSKVRQMEENLARAMIQKYFTEGRSGSDTPLPAYHVSEEMYGKLWLDCPEESNIDSCEHKRSESKFSQLCASNFIKLRPSLIGYPAVSWLENDYSGSPEHSENPGGFEQKEIGPMRVLVWITEKSHPTPYDLKNDAFLKMCAVSEINRSNLMYPQRAYLTIDGNIEYYGADTQKEGIADFVEHFEQTQNFGLHRKKYSPNWESVIEAVSSTPKFVNSEQAMSSSKKYSYRGKRGGRRHKKITNNGEMNKDVVKTKLFCDEPTNQSCTNYALENDALDPAKSADMSVGSSNHGGPVVEIVANERCLDLEQAFSSLSVHDSPPKHDLLENDVNKTVISSKVDGYNFKSGSSDVSEPNEKSLDSDKLIGKLSDSVSARSDSASGEVCQALSEQVVNDLSLDSTMRDSPILLSLIDDIVKEAESKVRNEMERNSDALPCSDSTNQTEILMEQPLQHRSDEICLVPTGPEPLSETRVSGRIGDICDSVLIRKTDDLQLVSVGERSSVNGVPDELLISGNEIGQDEESTSEEDDSSESSEGDSNTSGKENSLSSETVYETELEEDVSDSGSDSAETKTGSTLRTSSENLSKSTVTDGDHSNLESVQKLLRRTENVGLGSLPNSLKDIGLMVVHPRGCDVISRLSRYPDTNWLPVRYHNFPTPTSINVVKSSDEVSSTLIKALKKTSSKLKSPTKDAKLTKSSYKVGKTKKGASSPTKTKNAKKSSGSGKGSLDEQGTSSEAKSSTQDAGSAQGDSSVPQSPSKSAESTKSYCQRHSKSSRKAKNVCKDARSKCAQGRQQETVLPSDMPQEPIDVPLKIPSLVDLDKIADQLVYPFKAPASSKSAAGNSKGNSSSKVTSEGGIAVQKIIPTFLGDIPPTSQGFARHSLADPSFQFKLLGAHRLNPSIGAAIPAAPSVNAAVGTGPTYNSPVDTGSSTFNRTIGAGLPAFNSPVGAGLPAVNSTGGIGPSTSNTIVGAALPAFNSPVSTGSSTSNSTVGADPSTFNSTVGADLPAFNSPVGGLLTFNSTVGAGPSTLNTTVGAGLPAFDSPVVTGLPTFNGTVGTGLSTLNTTVGAGLPAFSSPVGTGLPTFNGTVGTGPSTLNITVGAGLPAFSSPVGTGLPTFNSPVGAGLPAFSNQLGAVPSNATRAPPLGAIPVRPPLPRSVKPDIKMVQIHYYSERPDEFGRLVMQSMVTMSPDQRIHAINVILDVLNEGNNNSLCQFTRLSGVRNTSGSEKEIFRMGPTHAMETLPVVNTGFFQGQPLINYGFPIHSLQVPCYPYDELQNQGKQTSEPTPGSLNLLPVLQESQASNQNSEPAAQNVAENQIPAPSSQNKSLPVQGSQVVQKTSPKNKKKHTAVQKAATKPSSQQNANVKTSKKPSAVQKQSSTKQKTVTTKNALPQKKVPNESSQNRPTNNQKSVQNAQNSSTAANQTQVVNQRNPPSNIQNQGTSQSSSSTSGNANKKQKRAEFFKKKFKKC